MNRLFHGISLASLLLATACYDSRWGEEKKVQRMTAAKMTAPELTAESDGPPRHARPMRVRAHVTSSYGAQVVDPQKEVRALLDDANAVTEPLLGVHLVLTDVKTWELSSDDDLHASLRALASEDAGEDVDWVAGFVGGFPRTTRSFHDLGIGALPGKHFVVRAPSRVDVTEDIDRQFTELEGEERLKLKKSLRKHRAGAVFLHELGHTLGAVHTASRGSIMFPAYDPRVSTFGTPVSDVMRAGLEHRDEPATMKKALVEALRRTPEDIFVRAERDDEIARLEQPTAAQPQQQAATRQPAAPPPIPETPSLTPADRQHFVDAFEARQHGDFMKSWEALKPLVKSYPNDLAVQDLRCTVATNVLPFEWARRECDALMELAKDRSRTR